jgi:SPP1 gp7 family putative phage head morphogenesis protein
MSPQSGVAESSEPRKGLEMPEPVPFEKVQPTDAIQFVRSLRLVASTVYQALTPRERLLAFTIPKFENLEMIEFARDLVARALEEGWAERTFRHRFEEKLAKAQIDPPDELDPEELFQDTSSLAYAYGRLKQMSDPEVMRVLSFWQYRTQEDERVRPAHRVLNLFVARSGDPVWRTIYPPLARGCRCTVDPLLRSEAEAILGDQTNIPGLDRLPTAWQPDPHSASIGMLFID